MRALATTRLVVFLARRAGGAEAVVARAYAGSFQAVGRRSLGSHEVEPFLAQLALAGIEVIEAAQPAPVAALPAPAKVAPVPEAARVIRATVESPWLTLSEILLATQKTRGPNVR